MIRGKDILRLPVVSRDVGGKIGQVDDLVIDRQGTRVLGIIVDQKGFLSGTRAVAWPDILVVGLDAVIVESESSLVKTSEVPEIQEVLDQGFVLHGSTVHTTAGRDLGRIENFFFDGETGAILGFELVGGLNADQPSGRSFMPAHDSLETGKDYTFVDPVVGDALEDFTTALKARSG